MGKNQSKPTLHDKLEEQHLFESDAIKKVASYFANTGIIGDPSKTPQEATYLHEINKKHISRADQIPSIIILEDDMISLTCHIRNAAKGNDHNHTVIEINRGCQKLGGFYYSFNEILLRFRFKHSDEYEHLYIPRDTVLRGIIYIGELFGPRRAFLKTYDREQLTPRDFEYETAFSELDDVLMLSIGKSTRDKTVGLLTEFSASNKYYHSSVILGSNCNVIQYLFATKKVLGQDIMTRTEKEAMVMEEGFDTLAMTS